MKTPSSLMIIVAVLILTVLCAQSPAEQPNHPTFTICGIKPGMRFSEAQFLVPTLLASPALDDISHQGSVYRDGHLISRKRYFIDEDQQLTLAISVDEKVSYVSGPVLENQGTALAFLRKGDPLESLKNYLQMPSPLTRRWDCYSLYVSFNTEGQQHVTIYHDWRNLSNFSISIADESVTTLH